MRRRANKVGYSMGWFSNSRSERLTGLIFLLLLASVCAQLWFSSAPLPLGGPNVIVAAAAVLLSLVYLALRALSLLPPADGGLVAVFRELRPLLPVLALSLILTVWALTIHIASGNLEILRIGQMALGVALFLAVYLGVERVDRARILILTIVIATFVAALLGLAIVWIGDPFLSLWLQVVTVRETDLETILTYGRTAGISGHPSTFSYQLATAVPLAFALLLHYPFAAGQRYQRARNIGLFLLLAVMTTALIVNGTRAAILGVLVGLAVIALPALNLPPLRRRLYAIVPALALWLLLFFNPLYPADVLAAQAAAAPGQAIDSLLDRAAPDIAGLAAGESSLTDRDHRPVHGYRIAGIAPGQEYTAQLRAHKADGAPLTGGEITAASDPDGSLLLTWYTPEILNVGGYQFRLKANDAGQWPPWQDFVPRSYGSLVPPIELVTTGPSDPDDSRRVLRHAVSGLLPGGRYVVQMRARDTVWYGAGGIPAPVTASNAGRLNLAWQEPPAAANITGYQYRLQRLDLAQWQPWQDVTAEVQVNRADFANLSGDIDALTRLGAGPLIGHTFQGLSFRYNYLAQLRPKFGDSYGAPSEEVVVRPWKVGEFTLTWTDSRDPAITGYQYRLRRFSVEEWVPWRDFVPTISAQGPQLIAVSPDRAVAVSPSADRPILRHLQPGLLPGLEYTLQLRARNQYGYGIPSPEIAVTAAADGAVTLAWLQPDDPAAITGYQFRQWSPVNLLWEPWQDFHPAVTALEPPDEILVAQAPPESTAIAPTPASRAAAAVVEPTAAPTPEVAAAAPTAETAIAEPTVLPPAEAIADEPTSTPPEAVAAIEPTTAAPAEIVVEPTASPLLEMAIEEPTVAPTDEPAVTEPTTAPTALASVVEPTTAPTEPAAAIEPPTVPTLSAPALEPTDIPLAEIPVAPPAAAVTAAVDTAPAAPAPPAPSDARLTAARTARDLAAAETEPVGSRLFSVSNWWLQNRACQVTAALRYAADYPLGTGIYTPDRSHICADIPEVMAADLLRLWPHNQFLHILVIYGIPGLILLILFYVLVIRSLLRSGRVSLNATGHLPFLGIAVIGSFTAYTFATLLTPSGPFIIDWSHFIIIGLIFSLGRITAALPSDPPPAPAAIPPA